MAQQYVTLEEDSCVSERNGSCIMTHLGMSWLHKSVAVAAVKPHRVSLSHLYAQPLIDTCPQSKDDLLHSCTPRERDRGTERQRDRESKGVWRNAAVQTPLWFSGHGAQRDSLRLKHRGDPSDVHPSGPMVSCSVRLCVCLYMCVCVCVCLKERE